MQTSSSSPLRCLTWGLVSYCVIFLAYGGFLLSHPSPYLTIPCLYAIILIPMWGFAITEILLQGQQTQLDGSRKRDDHLFQESYEQVILNRQKDLHRKVILPLCLVVGLLGPLGIALLQGVNPWQWPNLPSEHLRPILGFLLFLAGFQFVLGRFYIGIGKSNPQWQGLNAVGGLLHYATFITVCLALESLVSDESLAFFVPWTRGLSTLFALLYPIELLYRLLIYSYSENKDSFAFFCPQWPLITWSKKIQIQAQSSLQYQFGYDLGSNIRKLILLHGGPAFLLLIVCLMTANAFVMVPQGSIALITRWGIPLAQEIPPGLHLKYPWPIESAHLVSRNDIQRIQLGGPQETQSHLWDSPEHAKDLQFLLRTPKDLADQWPIEIWSASAYLDFRINNPRQWIFGYTTPEQTLRELALRQISLELLNTERDQFFNTARAKVEINLLNALQSQCNRLQLGVQLLKFTLPQIHPPKEATESFLSVIKARFQKDARLSKAKGLSEQLQARRENESKVKLSQAQARAEEIKAHVLSQLKTVNLIAPIVALAPDLYWERKKLTLLPILSADMHKIFILREGGVQVQNLNLEQALDPELLDLNLETRLNK